MKLKKIISNKFILFIIILVIPVIFEIAISGKLIIGNDVRIGYISQDTLSENTNSTILEYLTKDKALKKVANLLETRDISDIEITFKEEV